MARWFWIFWIYSLAGYGLEKGFARAAGCSHQVRKCFFCLPLCPVYGLGMLAVLALPDAWKTFPWILLTGGAAATAVEYLLHWLYDTFLGVRFWDYRGLKGSLHGRVCLWFSIAWGLLAAWAVYGVQPWVEDFAAQIPPTVTWGGILLLTADGVCSGWYLYWTGDIDGLRLRTVRELWQAPYRREDAP